MYRVKTWYEEDSASWIKNKKYYMKKNNMDTTGGNAALLKKATALRSGLSCYNRVLPYFPSPGKTAVKLL